MMSISQAKRHIFITVIIIIIIIIILFSKTSVLYSVHYQVLTSIIGYYYAKQPTTNFEGKHMFSKLECKRLSLWSFSVVFSSLLPSSASSKPPTIDQSDH